MYKVTKKATYKRTLKGVELLQIEDVSIHLKSEKELNDYLMSFDTDETFCNFIYEPLQKK